MVSDSNGKRADEIQGVTPRVENGSEIKDQDTLQIQTSQRGLLDGRTGGSLYLDIIRSFPTREKFKKFDPSPSAKFRRIAEERDEISRSVPSSDQTSTGRLNIPFVRKIDWAALKEMCKQWIRDPMNMALFAWILCVAISGAILFLVMTGMLNGALPKKSDRETWFEVNNQILNALFTLMCLYQHPKRIYHAVLLCRWRSDDVRRLRKVYCKNGTYKPNEWVHITVVVVLLNLNCFAQYALCGLNLGFPRSKRPAIGVGLCISVAIAAPAIASVYSILSPLGKEYEPEMDQEAPVQDTSPGGGRPAGLRLKSLEKRYSFSVRDEQTVPEARPQWIGGLSGVWDDISAAYLSFFCSCCVFGWNMQRLGFGNMYVHVVTFLLFCLAPFFIFNLAAVNIDSDNVREALGITGIFLCVFGLLYGGFWRIQMRKRFNLPGNTFCCGNASVTDCFQWLCCCSCSLAQEVRTADYYDVVEDKLCMKRMSDDTRLDVSPLCREDGVALFRSSPSSPYVGKSSASVMKVEGSSTPKISPGVHSPPMNLATVDEESFVGSDGSAVRAPIPIVIQREDGS